jgi:hypothetical protein
MKVLSGHYSPATAYVVSDYPYGFTLRCQIRYWLEVNKKGTRLVSQTTNPKKGNIWNTPKASTYSLMGAMYVVDENDGKPEEIGHVHWCGLSPYVVEKTQEYLNTYREGLQPAQIEYCEKLIAAIAKRNAAKAASDPTI